MKTNRRRFFATLLAPVLWRFSKPFRRWVIGPLTEFEKQTLDTVNRFELPPIGNLDPIIALARKRLTLQLVMQKYLPKEVLLEEDPEIET